MGVLRIPSMVHRNRGMLKSARVFSNSSTANLNSTREKTWACGTPRRVSHVTASSSAPEARVNDPTAIQNIDTCLFAELLTKPECKRTLVSIDPDSNGAISTFTWPALSISSPSSPRHQTVVEMLRAADIGVHDMPTETWQMRSREKKRPSALAIQRLLKPMLNDSEIVRIAVEFSTPTHLSGKFAWYDSGYASGLLDGVFQTMGVTYERVLVSSWKRELGLYKLGKPGSLALARELFVEQHEAVLKRKKDHGRAESLLIGAWALGLRKENGCNEVAWPESEEDQGSDTEEDDGGV
jgi:hypothetical protein